MAGVYIHIPFCGQLCTYCDFHFSTSLRDRDEMMEAIAMELHQRRDYLSHELVETIYFGGGTPSLLSISEIAILVEHISENFNLSEQLAEFTLESNPEDLTMEYLVGLRELGINRLSIGVQSFDDQTLNMMNRRHNGARASEAVRMAQQVGFDNISIDLIFGVPGRSLDVLKNDIEIALSLNTQHISAYHLTIEPKTVLGQRMRKGQFSPIEEQSSQEQYQLVESMLTDGGFVHYEVSNYALKGCEAVHNSSYWSGVPYIGIGPSAHSYNGAERQWNVSVNRDYITGVTLGGNYYETEILSDTDCYNEYVMTSLRTINGINLSYIDMRWGAERAVYVKKEAASFVQSGVMVASGDILSIAPCHFLLSDAVIEKLFM